jgi:hypothetical protein
VTTAATKKPAEASARTVIIVEAGTTAEPIFSTFFSTAAETINSTYSSLFKGLHIYTARYRYISEWHEFIGCDMRCCTKKIELIHFLCLARPHLANIASCVNRPINGSFSSLHQIGRIHTL